MLGEKKKWFKILTWEKYQELKDKPLEYENELTDLRTQIKEKNSKISKLEFDILEIQNEYNKTLTDKVKAENERDKAYDDISKLKKTHAEEKSELRKKINDLKNKSKVKK